MKASIEGTKKYFQKDKRSHLEPTLLGRTGWSVSPIGFGGYRTTVRSAVHRDALKHALLNGCNLIDTSTNYADGDSEVLVGQVLGALFDSSQLNRDQVVVVSKVGYVQGTNLVLARDRQVNGVGFPDMVKYTDDCWHCISPEFLEDQITRSLERLQLKTIDVLLLHNPEYYLKTEGDHSVYYERIRRAFEHLEKEVQRGRIQYYGISSNTFPDPKESAEFTSLDTVADLAQTISKNHRFAVIQFPFNLYEPGAVLEANNLGKTLLEFANNLNLGTLINRPLNSFHEDHLVRLADFDAPREFQDAAATLRDALENCMSWESRYLGKDIVPARDVAWGHILKHNMPQLAELDRWSYVLATQIRPTLQQALNVLEGHSETRAWAREYAPLAETMFAAFGDYLRQQLSQASQNIASALTSAVPALHESKTLSKKVVRIYRSFPGVHCVLVGMRQTKYVDDMVPWEKPLPAKEAHRALEAAGRMA